MKNLKRILKLKYEAMGFVEALIAIMVVGAASVVLMDIAVRTMQDVIQNETIDTMTQLAVEGSEMAQEIAKRDSAGDGTLFPKTAGCYSIVRTGEADDESFAFVGGGTFLVYEYDYDLTTRRTLAESFRVSSDEDSPYYDYFRTICFQDSPERGYLVAKVVVGLVAGDGRITKGNLVSDYEYLTVVDF